MNHPAAAFFTSLILLLFLGSLLAWGAIFAKLARRQSPLPLEPRLPVPWRGSEMLFLGLSFLAGEVFAGVLAQAFAASMGSKEYLLPAALTLQSIFRLTWLVGAGVFLIVRGAYLDDLGLGLAHTRRDVRTGVWFFLAASVPVLLVQVFFTQFLKIESKHPLIEMSRGPTDWILLVLATVAAVGVAPLFEEFIFRVLLQGWLEGEQVRARLRIDPGASLVPGYAPLVIASLLFAAMHAAAGPDPVAIFLLSLFLGYAYRQTHRLLPSVVIHVCLNGWTIFNLWAQYLTGFQP